MATNWRVYKNRTVASKLDRTELPGFFRKKIVVGPNEAAIIVRDGELQQIITEASFQAADVSDQLKSLFGVGADISVFFVDLSQFQLSVFFGESTSSAITLDEQSSIAVGSSARSPRDALPQMSGRSTKATGGGPAGFIHRLLGLQEKTIASAARKIGWQAEAEGMVGASAVVSSQFDVSRVSVVALSADRELIQGACHVRLRVNPDSLKELVSLLRGKQAIATWDIAALLRDEWFANVLVPELSRRHSAELRDPKLLAELESRIREALTRTLNTCGLILDSVSLNWGVTDQDRTEIARKRATREEEALEFAKTRRLAHLDREQQIGKARIANLQELKAAQTSGDQELRNLLLSGDLKRDLMLKENQVDFARVDARIRDITLDIEKKESVARIENRRAHEELRLDIEDREFRQKHSARLADIDADDKEMWSMVKMQIEMATQKHERATAARRQEIEAEFRKMQADIEDRYQQRKLKLDESIARMGMMERLVGQGLTAGQADASVLRTMLEQSTEQEYATTGDAIVKARAEGQAGAKDLETYRAAQADERAHQVGTTKLAAELMQASKQPIILPGGSAHGTTSPCKTCGREGDASWKVCPYCANPR